MKRTCSKCSYGSVETKRDGDKLVCHCTDCGHTWTEPYREEEKKS